MDAASNQEPKRVRRRAFLIDRKFQLKYTMIIVLVGVVVSALLGYFIFRLNQENRDLLGIEETMMAEVQRIDSYTMYYLAGFVAVMALVLFIWGIFITHRVAGPIFIISRYLRQLGQGDVPYTRPLRKGDELKAFFDTFSEMLNSMKQRNVEEAQLLEKIAGQIRSQGGDSEAAKALDELAAKKKTWGEPRPV